MFSIVSFAFQFYFDLYSKLMDQIFISGASNIIRMLPFLRKRLEQNLRQLLPYIMIIELHWEFRREVLALDHDVKFCSISHFPRIFCVSSNWMDTVPSFKQMTTIYRQQCCLMAVWTNSSHPTLGTHRSFGLSFLKNLFFRGSFAPSS